MPLPLALPWPFADPEPEQSCPAAEQIPPEVEQKVASVDGVKSAKAEIVWEPMWTKDMMSEVAKLQLGFF